MTEPLVIERFRRTPALALAAAGLVLGLAAGCATLPTFRDDRPHDSVVRFDGFEIRSDRPLGKTDPLVQELAELRVRLTHKLRLDPGERPVVVYLFADQTRYATYMQEHFPSLPDRRAFFVGSPGELAVYASWGVNIEADLRHECTHGLLHSALGEVPLWLDEGLAEYFEVAPRNARRINNDHVRRLGIAMNAGWRPDIDRLESLEDVADMQRADYQEAWAWVHFLMHESTAGRDVLIDYLHDLPGSDPKPRLSAAITETIPAAQQRMTAYVATLTSL